MRDSNLGRSLAIIRCSWFAFASQGKFPGIISTTPRSLPSKSLPFTYLPALCNKKRWPNEIASFHIRTIHRPTCCFASYSVVIGFLAGNLLIPPDNAVTGHGHFLLTVLNSPFDPHLPSEDATGQLWLAELTHKESMNHH